jgi:hypothetical protein
MPFLTTIEICSPAIERLISRPTPASTEARDRVLTTTLEFHTRARSRKRSALCAFIEGSMEPKLPQFQFYRDEDKHECNLIAIRVNALLTSQSLLLAAAAVLYATNGIEKKMPLIVIALLRFFTSALALIAIWIGCRVLSEWHRFGNTLIEADEQTAEKVIARYYLTREIKDGAYSRIVRRKQPDRRHFWSVTFFSIGMAAW